MKKSAGKLDSVWLGYDIQLDPDSSFMPQKIQFWKPADFKNQKPEAPFTYMSDALLGLSLIHLNSYLKSPLSNPNSNFAFCEQAWKALEPHLELFQRSQPRVQSLRKSLPETDPAFAKQFQASCLEGLSESLHPWGVDLTQLSQLVESIDHLEAKLHKPLLYNFELKFEKSFVEQLHYLHSLLFNLRALVALDYNAHVQDTTHEAVKVDSITDYLQRGEYVSNDALLYLQLLSQKEKLPAPAFLNLAKAFKQYSHNGFCLVENLPKNFLQQLQKEDFAESLYVVQMDWLLGSEAGLLFRIREELYGIQEGYDRVFWPDAEGKQTKTQPSLSVNCFVTAKDLGYQSVAV